jgi:hypothetical protein
VEYLAQATIDKTASVGGVEQARGQRRGHLVGVALAIGTGESIVVKQLAETEGQVAGVEGRQIVLVLERHVQVEQARLEGLGATAAPGCARKSCPASMLAIGVVRLKLSSSVPLNS